MNSAPLLADTTDPSTDARRADIAPDDPLRVVLVDEELPYPLTSGKRIRTYNLVQRLAHRHQLTYVCHRNHCPIEARLAQQHFADLGIRTVVVDRAVPPRSGIGFYLRLAGNLFSPLPYSVAAHTSRELEAALQAVAADQPVDLWHCEWTPYAHSLRHLSGPRIVMAHNVESVIWQHYHESAQGVLKRWYIARQHHKFRRFEKEILASVDLTVAVRALDAERFRTDLDVSRVDVVDNGVDVHFFQPGNEIRNQSSILFLGSLDWRPNLDGVVQFLDQVFPTLRGQVPAARFQVVGRNPPTWLTQKIASTPGVELHANVPDVRPFLASAGVMVVPLRIGGGSRLKILEALASGTPVVSTRVGAEGLELTHDEHLHIAPDVPDLTAPLVQVLRDPQQAQRQAQRGRARTIQRYDWVNLADRLEQLWRRCAEQRVR